MSRKFTYKKRGFNESQKRANQGAGSRDNILSEDVTVFSPSEGSNLLRILPPGWDDAEHYGYDIYVHYSIGPDRSSYLCLSKMKGEDCPICQERERALANNDEDYAKKLRPIKRTLSYIIDRDKENEGPKAWAMPWTVDKEIMTQATDERTRETLYIDDPEEGYDITVKREGTQQTTKYSVSIARHSNEMELTEEVLEAIEDHALPDILVFHEYDYIKKVFAGTPSAPKEDDALKSTRSASSENDVTWKDVHLMTFYELQSLSDATGLEFDQDDYDPDCEDDMADDICDELGIEKPKSKRRKKSENVKEKSEDEEAPKEEDIPFDKDADSVESSDDKRQARRNKLKELGSRRRKKN